MPGGQPEPQADPSVLADRGLEILEQAMSTGGRYALDTAIGLFERAADAMADDHPGRPATLSHLGDALRMRFEGTGALADLDRAVAVGRESVDCAAMDDVDRAMYLSNFAVALLRRYERAGRLEDLDQAIAIEDEAVDTASPRDPNRNGYLSNLGHQLMRRFERAGDLADVDRAIAVGQEAVDRTPENDEHRAMYLTNLGNALVRRFARTSALEDLDRAVEAGREAVGAVLPGDPNRGLCLSNLGNVLRTRFEHTGSLEDLGEAIAVGQEAVDLSPADHTNRALYLTNLGAASLERFEQTGSREDLERAVAAGREAVDITPAGHPNRAMLLTNLGNALRCRFDQTGDLNDVNQAVAVCEESVEVMSEGYLRAHCLNNLGIALELRFLRLGRLEDLRRAVDAGQEAVDASADDDPNQGMYLSNLANALRNWCERTGKLEDLDRVIDVAQKAVEVTPGGHPNQAEYLTNLGLALKSRFEVTGSLEDLERAVRAGEAAVNLTGEDDPGRAGWLSNLAMSMLDRFERTGTVDNLERAVQLAQQAVDASPGSDPDRGMYLTNLGIALRARFGRTGRISDLDRAAEAAQEAVDAVPDDHPMRATYLSNLGVILQRRFDHTGRAGDLDRAVEVAEQAVSATPEDHPDRSRYLIGFGRALRRRFRRTALPSDADRVLGTFREAAGAVTAPAGFRAVAAQEWGGFAATTERWDQAAEGFGTAIGLAALLAPPGLERADQEFRLGDVAGLASDAAAVCVQAGMPDRAVELLEQGRGVLFAQVLDSRTDLTDLRDAYPELADRFAGLRDELQAGPSDSGLAAADLDRARHLAADRRRDAAAEFGRVLGEVRVLPGFERFLAPRLIGELLPAAADGPVVLVNVAELRSDALVLTAGGVEVIPLQGVDPDVVAARVTRFLGAVAEAQYAGNTAAARAAAELQLGGVLGWLWDRVTGPVLDHLGYTATPPDGEAWPKVWWCPSGLLALLPLHAAGYHDLSGQRHEAVIDRVVSSTIPTIRALLHARRERPPAGEGRVLVVAMPRTPGQADLPGVTREASTLQQLFGGRADLLGLDDTPPATYDTVMAALPGHTWAHFSCHGESDLDDPSSSRLLLADHQTRPLTVLDLTHARLEDAELAFLSACTTARTGSKLPDEPIHLAAACQLAGYRHVIASLWPIGMGDTAWLTTSFYRSLTPTGTTSRDAARTAAVALHHGIRQLRAIYRASPSRWAPYSHTGP